MRGLLVFLIIINSSVLFGQMTFRGFSGGMMAHSGYLKSDDFTISYPDGAGAFSTQVKGAPFGLGGLLRFHFGSEVNQMRLGIEGYGSSINYSPHESYFSMGWGGVLVDYIRQSKWVSPFVGVNFGGARVKNTTLLYETADDFISEREASFRTYPFIAVTPFIGIEVTITQKLRAILKADYLINVSNRQPDFARGVRIYAGIIFQRPMNSKVF